MLPRIQSPTVRLALAFCIAVVFLGVFAGGTALAICCVPTKYLLIGYASAVGVMTLALVTYLVFLLLSAGSRR